MGYGRAGIMIGQLSASSDQSGTSAGWRPANLGCRMLARLPFLVSGHLLAGCARVDGDPDAGNDRVQVGDKSRRSTTESHYVSFCLFSPMLANASASGHRPECRS